MSAIPNQSASLRLPARVTGRVLLVCWLAILFEG